MVVVIGIAAEQVNYLFGHKRAMLMLFADIKEDIRQVGGVIASIVGVLIGIYFYWKSTNKKPDKPSE